MDTVAKQAREIKEVMERAYASRHEYQPVDARSFRHLDLGFYDRSRDVLVAKGATCLGDVENVTLKGIKGDLRTFARMLVSGDQVVSIGIHHPKPKLFHRIMMRLFRKSLRRTIDCVTELQEGGFIATSNTVAGGFVEEFPAEIDILFLPPETSVECVYEFHRQRLRDHLAASPETAFTRLRTMEDALEMGHRWEAAMSAFRKSIGLITEAELKKLGASAWKAARIKAEMERIERMA